MEPNPSTVPAMYTVEQVAEILSVSPATVRRLIKRGEIPGRQLGGSRGRYRIHKATFDAWLRERPAPRPNPNASWS